VPSSGEIDNGESAVPKAKSPVNVLPLVIGTSVSQRIAHPPDQIEGNWLIAEIADPDDPAHLERLLARVMGERLQCLPVALPPFHNGAESVF
jgi:hypothetical protein